MLNGAVHLAGAFVTAVGVFGADGDILTALPFGILASILTIALVAVADRTPAMMKVVRAR